MWLAKPASADSAAASGPVSGRLTQLQGVLPAGHAELWQGHVAVGGGVHRGEEEAGGHPGRAKAEGAPDEGVRMVD